MTVNQTIATHLELLPALQRAQSVYDRNTAQHSARVGIIATLVGEVLGLTSAELGELTWASALHDLGKLSISEEILRKQGQLTPAEWVQVRRHPVVGADILSAISPQLTPIAATIRAHHERWDGSGYPDELIAEQIPEFARVVAIADVFDVLTHPQPNRKGVLGHATAVEMIEHSSATKFDPRVIEAFVHLDHRGVLASSTEGMHHRLTTLASLSARTRISHTTSTRRRPGGLHHPRQRA